MLPEELESALAEYCVIMKERFYGLRSSDIHRMAFQLAIRNKLIHPFSQQKGTAGEKVAKEFSAVSSFSFVPQASSCVWR
jgi:hypothetical protein